MNRIRVAFANRDFAIDDTALAFPTDDRGAWIAGLASLPAGADSAAAPTPPAAPRADPRSRHRPARRIRNQEEDPARFDTFAFRRTPAFSDVSITDLMHIGSPLESRFAGP